MLKHFLLLFSSLLPLPKPKTLTQTIETTTESLTITIHHRVGLTSPLSEATSQQPLHSPSPLYHSSIGDRTPMDALASDIKDDCKINWDFTCDLEVDFHSEKNASIVYSALAVDKELQPDKVKRQMSISDGKLSVRFEAVEARFLRASFSAFLDVLTLATKTIEEFGQEMIL